MDPDIFLCAAWGTVSSRQQALGPMQQALHGPHCGDSFQCSQQSDPESTDLLKLAGKLKFSEQSLGNELGVGIQES